MGKSGGLCIDGLGWVGLFNMGFGFCELGIRCVRKGMRVG